MKGRVGQSDEEYIRAAHEWARETERQHNCGVRISLVPTSRKGVWKARAQCCEVVDGRAVGVRLQVEGEWPTSQHSTLAGYLMNLLMQLDHQMGIDELQAASDGV